MMSMDSGKRPSRYEDFFLFDGDGVCVMVFVQVSPMDEEFSLCLLFLIVIIFLLTRTEKKNFLSCDYFP